ncbi:hypothetical protein LGN04_29770 [Burkholderia multivorans]|uniref:hypothetical protein n=1 Tax=Burkholderia multivorans TaxID=87883 RepID=UPI001C224C57|nr:hypothetical protein [Burkholderia multivorans]MBU9583028.1 hypothetical protein [Burkholderia multivorans]MCA8458088.1 hypothetical protein [Burkholderia multivorans]MDR8751365.1 hypothetical protein [Burkholderia multivorans]MDR8810405.1 hypothetical protein [Burkholderia multivorans]
MALHLVEQEKLYESCRSRILSCELWLRSLIDDTLRADFGAQYHEHASINGNPLFSEKMRSRIAQYHSSDPNRFPRPVDAILLDDLGSILGKEDAFKTYFRSALIGGFPCGSQQVRHVVTTLKGYRNAVFHANERSLSFHDLERVLCYSSDLIATIKRHYATMNNQSKFPAPMFTRYSDSLGNVRQITQARDDLVFTSEPLYRGETVTFMVEVDGSFAPTDYRVVWRLRGVPVHEGCNFSLLLDDEHVGERLPLQVEVVSNEKWHRMNSVDALITFTYEVLPMARPSIETE